MQGIGAATASAMLAVLHPSLPFMSDEAAAAVLPASPKYTVPEWRQVAEVLRQKATSLSSSSGKTKHEKNVQVKPASQQDWLPHGEYQACVICA